MRSLFCYQFIKMVRSYEANIGVDRYEIPFAFKPVDQRQAKVSAPLHGISSSTVQFQRAAMETINDVKSDSADAAEAA